MNSILEVENLSKSFKGFRLKNISFSIKKGSITGFIGLNGSGKTTTIKSILGLTVKDSGTIKFLNQDIDNSERKIKNQIGFVLDDGYFYEQLTLKEMKNVIAPAYQDWNEKTFLSYINQFDLSLNQKISTLSKGMRMKFALALALSHNAKLLIMDEPTSGLDPLVRTELMDILLEFMNRKDHAVFFSTHITSDLDKIADTIILIDNGKIILNGQKEKILEDHRLIKGKNHYMTNEIQKLFINYKVMGGSFKALVKKRNLVEKIPNILVESPTIEDIMLAYIEGGHQDVD